MAASYWSPRMLFAPRFGLISDKNVQAATKKRDDALKALRRFEAEHANILAENWEQIAERKEREAARREIEERGEPDPKRPNIITQTRDMRPRILAQRDALIQKLQEADLAAWELAQARASADIPAAYAEMEKAAEEYLAKWEELEKAKAALGERWNRLIGLNDVARGKRNDGVGRTFPIRREHENSPLGQIDHLRRLYRDRYGEPTAERPVPLERKLRIIGERESVHTVDRLTAAAMERSARTHGQKIEYLDGFPPEVELLEKGEGATR